MKVTVQMLADAIRQNGWEQAFGDLYQDKYGLTIIDDDTITGTNRKRIRSACALGQARLNLHLVNRDRWRGFLTSARMRTAASQSDIIDFIVTLNDSEHKHLDEIADALLAKYDSDIVLWG